MQLSPNFSLAELTKSETAEREKIDNTPGPITQSHLRSLAGECLEPIRALVGRPIRINSGYRSLRLNAAVGGSATSAHVEGLAADIECPGISNYRLAIMILESGLILDQLILEEYAPGVEGSGWVHVGLRVGIARRQSLTKFKKDRRYYTGILEVKPLHLMR